MKKILMPALLFILASCGDEKRESFIKNTITSRYSNQVVVSIEEAGALEWDNRGSIFCNVTLANGIVKDTIQYSKAGDGNYILASGKSIPQK